VEPIVGASNEMPI